MPKIEVELDPLKSEESTGVINKLIKRFVLDLEMSGIKVLSYNELKYMDKRK